MAREYKEIKVIARSNDNFILIPLIIDGETCDCVFVFSARPRDVCPV